MRTTNPKARACTGGWRNTAGALAVLLAAGSVQAQDRDIAMDIVYPSRAFQQNGGPVVNIRSTTLFSPNAVGDGVTDDTAAFVAMVNHIKDRLVATGKADPRLTVYLPSGTYLVSDTITHSGSISGGFSYLRLVGQNRANTIIRLKDNSAGFGAGQQKPVITWTKYWESYQGNVMWGNQLRNVTIDTGSGNPGAVGMAFFGANGCSIDNVTIRSGDGLGYCGLFFPGWSVQGHFCDITVDGFDYGVCFTDKRETNGAFEYLTLKNQCAAGFAAGPAVVSIRKLLSQSTVPALSVTSDGAQAVILDSRLEGGAPANAAIVTGDPAKVQALARNVTVAGYGASINVNNGAQVVTGAIAEWLSGTVFKNYAWVPSKTMNLPVEEAQLVPWEANAANWTTPEDYSGTDAQKIQAALNSGKPAVCIPKAYNAGNATITIPSTVRQIEFLHQVLSSVTFRIDQGATGDLWLEHPQNRLPLQVNARRNVHVRYGSVSYRALTAEPVSAHFETVAVLAGGNRDDFCPVNVRMYARSPNEESSSAPNFTVNGGVLWVLGFKTERPYEAFVAKNGGFLEVLGGYQNFAGSDDLGYPVVRNLGANVSYVASTHMSRIYQQGIWEVRGAVTNKILNAAFPRRASHNAGNYVVPLYVGYEPLPSPWQNLDIGATGTVGGARHRSGTFTVQGAGADIYGTADAFQFAYQPLAGDATVTARVTSQQNTDPWAKAGVMIRETLNANSRHAMAAVTPTMGVAFLRRTSTGGASENTTVAGLSAPCWVRIVRAGNNFSAYRSADGSAWTQIGATVAISMSSTIYVGLPVTSHVAGTLCQATFDNVTITQPTVPNAPSALTATAVSASQINLSWTDNSSNETGFRIERKTGSGGSWSQIATVGANVTAYADTGLSAGTQYTYRVRAAGSGGDSGYSNEANATTQSGGGTPGGLLETFNAGSAVADQTTFESVFLVDTLSGNKWTHSGTAGVGGGGAIQAPGGQNASAVHRTATPSFAVGETRILSLDTYVTYRTSSEPTFGISWWAYIKDTLSAGNGGLTVELRYIPPASRTPSEPERFHLLANGTKIGAPALTSGTWLGWDIAWTKTAAGTFDVAVTLSDLGSAGTGTPTPIGTYTRQGVASSAMAAATQVYAGIQGRARDGTGVFRVDNFAVGAAATVALDETFNAGSAVTDQTTLESVFLIDTLSGNKWSYAGTGGTGGTGGLQAPGGQNASAVHRTAAPGFAVGETHILSLDTYVTYRTSSEPTFGISWWAYIKDTLSAGNGGLTVELRYIPPTSRTVAEPERFHLLANGTKIGAPAFTSGTWLGWDIAWTKTAAGTFNVAVTLSDLDAAGTGAPTPIGTYTRQGIASSAMAAATQVYAGIQGRARDGTGVFRVDNVKVMAQ